MNKQQLLHVSAIIYSYLQAGQLYTIRHIRTALVHNFCRIVNGKIQREFTITTPL